MRGESDRTLGTAPATRRPYGRAAEPQHQGRQLAECRGQHSYTTSLFSLDKRRCTHSIHVISAAGSLEVGVDVNQYTSAPCLRERASLSSREPSATRIHPKASVLAALALVFATSAFPTRARAYRTVAEQAEFGGQPRVTWNGPITFEEVVDAEYGTVASWVLDDFRTSLRGIGCASVPFEVMGGFAASSSSGDGRNTIQFIRSGWSDLGYTSDRMAVTELRYVSQADGSWAIAEADIRLNAESFDFGYHVTPAMPGVRELSAVLVHELGHALGLEHPCELGGAPGIPDCGSDPTFMTLTMYPGYAGASQGTWADDDIAGICFQFSAQECAERCPSGSACVNGACGAICGSTVCGAGDVCENAVCRAKCGAAVCAGGDVCIGASCRAVCQGSACAEGEVCGPTGCAPRHCSGATCIGPARACDATNPCPTEATCVDGVCESPDSMRCTADAECSPGERCIASSCTDRWARPYDPCAAPNQCTTGICVAETCRPACSDELTCSTIESCASLGSISYCESTASPFGVACTTGIECASRACLLIEGTHQGTCTRPCDVSVPDCPSGTTCLEVDGSPYCRPPVPATPASCQLALGSAPGPFHPLCAVASILAIALVTRRHRRK